MIARSLLLTLTSSLLVVGGSAAADARRPYLPQPQPQAQVDVQLLCDGASCQEVRHHGARYVVGEQGQRYEISLTNRSDRWVEAVVTVDGRNIVDGDRASSRSRGYLIAPYDSVSIEGWRTSAAEVAAFRFTSVGDSYAGRVGDARLAGTVRVEVYPERRAVAWVPPRRDDWDEDAPSLRRDGASAPKSDRAATAGEASRGDRSRWQPLDDGQNLGTQFGESRWQPVRMRDFQRADPNRPSQTVTLWYDDARGLIARGVLAPPRWIEEDRWVAPPPRSW